MSTVTERPKPKVDDIENSIDSFLGRLGRAWKKLLILAIVVGLFWFVVGPNIGSWLQYILYGVPASGSRSLRLTFDQRTYDWRPAWLP